MLKRLVLFAVLLALPLAAQAQDAPTVEVSDQVSLDGTVLITRAVSDGPGFVVIHADNGEGAPGPVIGFRGINSGENTNFKINIDATAATPTVFAMLHTDSGEAGVYEFGTVEGADGPVRDADGNVITPPLNIDLIRAYDQLVDGTFTAASVVAQVDGFLVLHEDNGEGAPGPVLGFAPVSAGTNLDVAIEVEAVTETVFPMLHVDTGEAGTYEFGQVEGADGPVVVDGVVAVMPVVTVPSARVSQQIVTDTVVAESVVSDGPGFLVIHQESGEGSPGPVIGFAAVEAGTNLDVVIDVDPAGVTPVLWPMLHVDTGEVGTYEFGQVEGADGPVRNSAGDVITFRTLSAPSFTALAQPVQENGAINIGTVLAADNGWMVIHADNGEGGPGPVIGFSPVLAGLNENVGVLLTGDMTPTVFPMLHVDTGELGAYEFGQVEGADGPVRVGDAVVVGPLEITE